MDNISCIPLRVKLKLTVNIIYTEVVDHAGQNQNISSCNLKSWYMCDIDPMVYMIYGYTTH